MSGSEAAAFEQFARDIAGRATQSADTPLDALLPAVYDEMRVLAAYLLRGERVGRTLRPTALAHEAYLRLAGGTGFEPESPGHLLAVAANVMRRVLIDQARARATAKRGGELERVTLSESLLDDAGTPVDLIDLQRALDRLGHAHPRKVQVVEMIYFAGLTEEEVALALGVNERTVRRDWQFARAWLWQELNERDLDAGRSAARP
jgi:RNA polymerase sigma factor (TIGR02999 family)